MTIELRSLDPTVIGGTGGSGTRALARILQTGGAYIGSNLNHALDQREIAGYHNNWINRWLCEPDSAEDQMRDELAGLLEGHLRGIESPRPWGWKCPTSIYLLRFFNRELPKFRFIHLVRDGRDMAFARNQHQLRKHGEALLSDPGPYKPRHSISL